MPGASHIFRKNSTTPMKMNTKQMHREIDDKRIKSTEM